jgi:hypothetical protein
MTMRTLLKPIVTAVLVAVLGGPALAAARPERPVPAETAQAAKKPAAATTADAARYAQRETKTPQQMEQFKGGALNIYIGGTALAIAAFIVILLVLL